MAGPRLLKTYNYGATTVVMSSSAGFLSSIDDFYMTSKQMVIIETTNGNFNDTLWKRIRPESVLSWMRGSVANMLATSTQEWSLLFRTENSGTYNNQWC